MVSKAKQFLIALSFYTRIPCPGNLDYKQLAPATVFLPLIGWVVGGFIAITFVLANFLWSSVTALVIAFTVGVLVTGAFHEDGFADVCDGFGGGYGKERILTIMKDSQIGAYGAIGLILLFLLKISSVNDLPETIIPWALFTGQSVSRLAPLVLMRRYQYARAENSKSIGAVYNPSIKELAIATVMALLPMSLLPLGCLWVIGILLPVNLLLGQYFYRHIGGYTGDCLGASQQVTEVAYYLSLSALWIYI